MARFVVSTGFVLALATSLLADPPKPPPPGKPDSPKLEPPKSVEVAIDGMKAIAPAAWKSEKPANRLRSHQFKLAKAAGDKEDAELFVLPEFGGKVDESFEALKDLFIPPTDLPKDKAIKQTKFTVGTATVHMLDLQGTYRVKHIPVDQAVKELKLDYRMIAVIWKTEKTSCSIRLVGPKKTVEAHAKEFENWLKSFK